MRKYFQNFQNLLLHVHVKIRLIDSDYQPPGIWLTLAKNHKKNLTISIFCKDYFRQSYFPVIRRVAEALMINDKMLIAVLSL